MKIDDKVLTAVAWAITNADIEFRHTKEIPHWGKHLATKAITAYLKETQGWKPISEAPDVEPSCDVVEKVKLPQKNLRFTKEYHANPDGSKRERCWFIFYEDTEHPPMFFTDEICAREAYAHELQNWHCHLLEQVADPLYDFKNDRVLKSYDDHKALQQKPKADVGKAMPNVAQNDGLVEEICELFNIGEFSRDKTTILTNIKNARRRSRCLSEIENYFTTTEIEDGEEFENCLLNWGEEPEKYIETFKQALSGKASIWQDISTAPKDGTRILLRYWKNNKSYRTIHTKDFYITEGYYHSYDINNSKGELILRHELWKDYAGRLLQDTKSQSKNKVIHWMPLPPIPLTERREG